MATTDGYELRAWPLPDPDRQLHTAHYATLAEAQAAERAFRATHPTWCSWVREYATQRNVSAWWLTYLQAHPTQCP